MQKDIIILTESDKNHAFCVAGIDIHTGRWVRLVTEDEDTDGALTALVEQINTPIKSTASGIYLLISRP